MNHSAHQADVRIDLTAKAQRLGLCPLRRDVMVQMEQPLINEVAALFDSAASLHPSLDQLHWIERLDAFLTEARHKLSFRQANEAGGSVRKGERSTLVCFYKPVTRLILDDAGEPVLDEQGNPKMLLVFR